MRIYGLTVDSVEDFGAIISGLQGLPRVTLRVVMDRQMAARDYLAAVKALSHYADIMLQPVDSEDMIHYRLRQYSSRFADALQVLGEYATYVEAGNEVNGDWAWKSEDPGVKSGVPEDVADKVNNAVTQCKRFGVAAAVTYFYDGDAPEQMSNWANAFPLNPDLALASVYPNSSVRRPSFDDALQRLQALFPDSPKGFGEYGTEDGEGKNTASAQLRGNLVRVVERYVPPDTVARYVGGGFYWDAYQDVFKTASLAPVFRQVWSPASA